MSTIASPPLQDSLIEIDPNDPQRRKPSFLSKSWAIWLQQSLIARTQSGSETLKTVTSTGQTAAIASTPVPLGSIPDGPYRVSVYARITTAASVSSSLTPSITWTDGGVVQSKAVAAMTGNTTNTNDGFVTMFHGDANAPISYAAAYASVGTAMAYRMDVIVEFLG